MSGPLGKADGVAGYWRVRRVDFCGFYGVFDAWPSFFCVCCVASGAGFVLSGKRLLCCVTDFVCRLCCAFVLCVCVCLSCFQACLEFRFVITYEYYA